MTIFRLQNLRPMAIIIAAIAVASLKLLAADLAVSPFGEGNWVKVEILNSGLHEISYDDLRKMGFENPSSVGVYGRGGTVLPENFTDASGKSLFDDTLSEVAVLHKDGKMYFYGVTTTEIKFKLDRTLSTGGLFERVGRNIYSSRGYYFLTDRNPSPATMKKKFIIGEQTQTLDKGMGYLYHEKDQFHNNTSTGQLYWGENFANRQNANETWLVSYNDMIPGGNGVATCEFYTDGDALGILSYGVTGAKGNPKIIVRSMSSSYYMPQTPTTAELTMPASADEFFVEFSNKYSKRANLDYWIMSFERGIPTLTDNMGIELNQDQISFLPLDTDKTGIFSFTGTSKNWLALDITDRTSPFIITEDGICAVAGGGGARDILVFDPQRKQKSIFKYKKVTPTSLREKAVEGADLLIITTPTLRHYADRMAQLHKKNEGIEVLVANVENVYDHYSQGIPDPMAYRGLVRQMYRQGGRTLKNVLLMGPIYGEYRGLSKSHDPTETLIAYQNPLHLLDKDAANVNDFYGMTDNYINLSKIETAKIRVGVGLLPCYDATDGDTYLSKLESYLENDELHRIVNETFTIGGLGDAHTHDRQAKSISELISSLSDDNMIDSSIAIDALGNDEARKKFTSCLDNGKSLGLYIGHGGPAMLGLDKNFFTVGEALDLRNKFLSFMVFAGCNLSEIDKGRRGIGEIMVLGTPSALIGGIMATRSVWSVQNFNFTKRFFNNLFESASLGVTNPSKELTIGELVAKAKNEDNVVNDLAFQLIGDPSLKIHLGMACIKEDETLTSFSGSAGETVKLSGKITDRSGKTMSDFNGRMAVKIMEPEKTLLSQDLVTGTLTQGVDSLYVRYTDNLITEIEGKVTDGQFSVDIDLPVEVNLFSGQRVNFYMSAYDYDKKIGASGKYDFEVMESSGAGDSDFDDKAPVVDGISFDVTTSQLRFSVTDNRPFRPNSSAMKVVADGQYFSGGLMEMSPVNRSLTAYDCSMSLRGLSDGRHELGIFVTDASGNVGEATTGITTGRPSPAITLSLVSPAPDKQMEFTLKGDFTVDSKIVIYNSAGEKITEISRNWGKWVWDGTSGGKRVAPGLYKAIAVGPSPDKWSEPVNVPVL